MRISVSTDFNSLGLSLITYASRCGWLQIPRITDSYIPVLFTWLFQVSTEMANRESNTWSCDKCNLQKRVEIWAIWSVFHSQIFLLTSLRKFLEHLDYTMKSRWLGWISLPFSVCKLLHWSSIVATIVCIPPQCQGKIAPFLESSEWSDSKVHLQFSWSSRWFWRRSACHRHTMWHKLLTWNSAHKQTSFWYTLCKPHLSENSWLCLELSHSWFFKSM